MKVHRIQVTPMIIVAPFLFIALFAVTAFAQTADSGSTEELSLQKLYSITLSVAFASETEESPLKTEQSMRRMPSTPRFADSSKQ
jgi:hypothetical protein